MKKTNFRVQLFLHETEIAKSLILLAARHNSGMLETSINKLKEIGDSFKEDGREINFELVGETQLCIDMKLNGNWHPSAVIEEIEIFELEENFNPVL